MSENTEQGPHTSVIHCVDCRDSGELSIGFLLEKYIKVWKLGNRRHFFKLHQHLIFKSCRGIFWFWVLASVSITVGLPIVSAQGYDTIPRPCSKDSQRFCSRCENTTSLWLSPGPSDPSAGIADPSWITFPQLWNKPGALPICGHSRMKSAFSRIFEQARIRFLQQDYLNLLNKDI